MLISGLQKLSLVDFPGRTAATVFTGGCDLRCPYCHNSELLKDPPRLMDTEELLAFLRRRRGLLDGVCVTGGEPCLHRDLPEFLARIHELSFAVKLDTNGAHPDMLAEILREDLADYVAMDLKNSPALYAGTVGLASFDVSPVLRSLRLLWACGAQWELRTTCVLPLHDDGAFRDLRDLLLPLAETTGRRVPLYALQPFRDSGNVSWAGLSAPSAEQLRAWCALLAPVAERVGVRGIEIQDIANV